MADFNFGKKFAELEAITKEFEQGELDLDKGLEKFEKGLALAEDLKKHLSKAETKINVIKEKFSELYEEK